jgi:hypothetical protein
VLHAEIQQTARKSHAVADLIDDTKRRLSAA